MQSKRLAIFSLCFLVLDQAACRIALLFDPTLISTRATRLMPLQGVLPWLLAVALWMALVLLTLRPKTILPLALMGGGVLSNALTLATFGIVVDYIPWIFGLKMNLADILIVAGIIFLPLSLRSTRTSKHP